MSLSLSARVAPAVGSAMRDSIRSPSPSSRAHIPANTDARASCRAAAPPAFETFPCNKVEQAAKESEHLVFRYFLPFGHLCLGVGDLAGEPRRRGVEAVDGFKDHARLRVGLGDGVGVVVEHACSAPVQLGRVGAQLVEGALTRRALLLVGLDLLHGPRFGVADERREVGRDVLLERRRRDRLGVADAGPLAPVAAHVRALAGFRRAARPQRRVAYEAAGDPAQDEAVVLRCPAALAPLDSGGVHPLQLVVDLLPVVRLDDRGVAVVAGVLAVLDDATDGPRVPRLAALRLDASQVQPSGARRASGAQPMRPRAGPIGDFSTPRTLTPASAGRQSV
jgi:hypothetical protein